MKQFAIVMLTVLMVAAFAGRASAQSPYRWRSMDTSSDRFEGFGGYESYPSRRLGLGFGGHGYPNHEYGSYNYGIGSQPSYSYGGPPSFGYGVSSRPFSRRRDYGYDIERDSRDFHARYARDFLGAGER